MTRLFKPGIDALVAEAAASPGPPPFRIGQRMLVAAQPWRGSGSLVSLNRDGGRWRVEVWYDGDDKVVDCDAAVVMAAPADWIEPPAQPLSRMRVALSTYAKYIPRETQAEKDAHLQWLRDWQAWAEKYLAPIGTLAIVEEIRNREFWLRHAEAERQSEMREAAE